MPWSHTQYLSQFFPGDILYVSHCQHQPALSLPDTLIVTNHFITPSIFLFLSIIAHPREVTKVTPSCPDSFCNHLDDSQPSTPPTVMSALATHLRFPRP